MKGMELDVTQHESDLGLNLSSNLKVSSQQQAYSMANIMPKYKMGHIAVSINQH